MKTDEDFFAIVEEYWEDIRRFYLQFINEDEKPIMELSLPSLKIYAYAYSEYLKILGKRSQDILKKEYPQAIASNKIVVFVKDEEEKVLKSASFSM